MDAMKDSTPAELASGDDLEKGGRRFGYGGRNGWVGM